MPQLVALHKRKADKGLAVIGLHVQNGTDAEVTEVSKKLKIKFPVMKGGSAPSSGNGIPHSLVFDSTGKLVFEGHPADKDFDKAVEKALKAVAAAPGSGGSGLGPKPGSTPAPDKSAPAKPAVLLPEREWTNADGKKMSAALLSLSGDTATFKMKSGKTFTYDITKLSAEDQTTIKEAAAAPPAETK